VISRDPCGTALQALVTKDIADDAEFAFVQRSAPGAAWYARHAAMKKPAPPALDRFDLRILQRYQLDTQQPAHRIAAKVGLSTAAVQRRLKRMRDHGVIERELAQIAPAAVGLPVTCIVGVDLEREGTAELERFRKRMLGAAEVQQCYFVTGQSDFILIVLVQDMAAYEAFTRRALQSDPNVKAFTTHVVLDRAKVSLEVALDHALATTPD